MENLSTLFDTLRAAYANKKYQKVIDDNQNVNFIQRMSPTYQQTPLFDGESPMTHKMAWGGSDGDFMVFPTVQDTSGGKGILGEFDMDEAFNRAVKSKDYVVFNNENDAKGFAEGGWKTTATGKSFMDKMNTIKKPKK